MPISTIAHGATAVIRSESPADSSQGKQEASNTSPDPPILHLDYLDSLRGMAVLGVLVVHSVVSIVSASYLPIYQIAFLGQRGVQLFYMVSAFTLFYTLDAQRKQSHPTRSFYLRRFFRIAPLYYLDMLCVALFRPLSLPPLLFLSGVIFLNGASPQAINNVVPAGWSIAVEVWFYVLVPLLFRHIRTLEQAVKYSIAITLIAVVISYVLGHRSNSEYFTFVWFPIELPVFMLGIITYFLWKGIPSMVDSVSASSAQVVTRRGLACVLLCCSAACLLGTVNLLPHESEHFQWRNTHLLPASFGFVPLILAVSLYQFKWLVNKCTIFLGRISYSMYLTHYFLLLELMRHFPRAFSGRLHDTARGAALVFLVVIALTVPLSTFLWHFVEKPGIRLGRRFLASLDQKSARSAEERVPPFISDAQL